MTRRLPVSPAPSPLEDYGHEFDPLFDHRPQRDGFRRYLEGLLLPAERNTTLTALANTAPLLGAQHPRAQSVQWFLSESTWDPRAVHERRLALRCADPLTAPTARGVLVIDEHGDRKWGRKTAHGGKQYLANLGTIDNGVVSVTSLWADEQIYYPLHVEPYTPAPHFPYGKADPAFRTKRASGQDLVRRAVSAGIPFRAVVADSFYGEDHGFQRGMRELGGYVLASNPRMPGCTRSAPAAPSRKALRRLAGRGRRSQAPG
jgi:SRSO17 transposase